MVMLREMTSDWNTVVKDHVVSDASAIGKQNGQAKISIDLSNLTPSNELPNGNFYFLLPRFKTSTGEEFAIQGMNPINIVRRNTTSVEEENMDIKLYPNPANNMVVITSYSIHYTKLYEKPLRLLKQKTVGLVLKNVLSTIHIS